MRIVCLQENLEGALSLINRTATVKTQLPITTNVLLKATKDGIELIGTDLENTTKAAIAGKTEKEGGILLPTRTLIEIVHSLPKEQVTLETEGLIMDIASGAYKIKMNGIAPEEFPEPQPPAQKEALDISEITLFIKEVAFACATDESRAALTGVLLTLAKDGVLLVATDGYRLSLKKVPGKKESGNEEKKLIIPAKVLLEAAKIVEEKDGGSASLLFGDGKTQAAFVLPDVTIFTRLIEGEFPPYEKIIPQTHDSRAVFDKEDFLKAVKLSSVFARESANIVRLKITRKGIVVSANAPQVGENTCEVEGTLEGDENEIAFNSRFLLDFLANAQGKEIAFEMTGPLNPGVFKVVGDDSYFHIIMPVRVQGE